MTHLIFALLLPIFFQTASSKTQSKVPPELEALRKEFVKATQEYKESLIKLRPFYERDVARAEEKLEQSKKLATEGMVPPSQVEENERALQSAKSKLEETKKAIAGADDQIAGVLNDAAIEAKYKQAVVQRRKERKPRCAQWSLTTYYRVTKTSVESGYRFVCR